MVKVIHASVEAFYRALEVLMVICITVMLIMVFGNVVLRLFFNTGIDLSEEIPRFAFVWMTFIGAIVGMRHRAHLGVDIVTKMLPLAGESLLGDQPIGHAGVLFLHSLWHLASARDH